MPPLKFLKEEIIFLDFQLSKIANKNIDRKCWQCETLLHEISKELNGSQK
jgi:hypothetical protein